MAHIHVRFKAAKACPLYLRSSGMAAFSPCATRQGAALDAEPPRSPGVKYCLGEPIDGTVEGSCYEATVRCIGVRLRALCAMGSCEDFCQQLLHSAVRVCGLVVALPLVSRFSHDSDFCPMLSVRGWSCSTQRCVLVGLLLLFLFGYASSSTVAFARLPTHVAGLSCSRRLRACSVTT